MSRDLKAPDHTTLSRRNQIVVVPPLTRAHDGPIDLIVDSTGLKILGRGEWNAHKHKTSKKRRDWRKLHIGVDAEGFIVAAELTASSRDDASTLPDLLAPLEVPIRRFTADGAYDPRSVYDRASAAGTENVVIVIPLVALRCRRGPPTVPGRSFRGFARSGDGSGRRSRATDSRRALRTASSDTSPCSEATGRRGTARRNAEKPRSGVTSSTGWPSSVGHRRTLLVGDGPVSRVRCGPVPIHAPTPRHETKIGVRFTGPDKLVHLIEAGKVVQRLGRGVEGFNRTVHIREDFSNGNQTVLFARHGSFSHAPQTRPHVRAGSSDLPHQRAAGGGRKYHSHFRTGDSAKAAEPLLGTGSCSRHRRQYAH